MTQLDKLEGFDESVAALMQQWNAPAVGVAVVVDGEPVLTRGYGFREYAKRLPFDTSTRFPIASNTKLFVALAAGMLVEEGKLTFDGSLCDVLPELRFHNDILTRSVTLRDLLAHRTGITRHDMMTFGAAATPKDVFNRLHLMKPSAGLRETFIYNNVMYYAAAHVIERLSGMSWTDFVRERMLEPADMRDTSFRFAALLEEPNLAVGYTERRDSRELRKLDTKRTDDPPWPSGSMVSTLDDMSRWLTLLIDDGKAGERQVLPKSALHETMVPAIPLPNAATQLYGWWESLNGTYGLGRQTEVYRGHLVAFHGGDLRGFHSRVSVLPRERIGVSVFVIGDHCAMLRDVVHYQLCERLLGLDITPWNERFIELAASARQAMSQAASTRYADRIDNTTPSHPLEHYAGDYAHDAYGTISIVLEDGRLRLTFRDQNLPLAHYHYERFDAEADDPEDDARWRINFQSTHEGDIDRFVTKIVENEVVFVRKEFAHASAMLQRFAGAFQTATGIRVEVLERDDGTLWLRAPGQRDERFVAARDHVFRIASAPGSTFEFIESDGQIVSLDQMTGAGRFVLRKM
ncbi:serine hydrolase [Paraburkholderia sp. Tr-20389]|uniref:serine hydrolase n=1 Tax=Paraburkholderia sp. Tr-20389 TaxID=2703903 RepID=UPI00198214BB|nr:serine hydrolase [Paraburkholderia sp. Tr-20389]MBN3753071.1 serine hydrolase [Paraburkholderia sp. Tr-20389]